MSPGRYILRNITPLNVILLAFFIIAAALIYPALNRAIRVRVPKPEATEVVEKQTGAEKALPDISDYAVVGELNLFHPERKPPPPEEEKPDIVQAPLAQVDFTLYGTLVSDDVTLAFVEERGSSRRVAGRRKRISVLRVGDVISGYTLKSIEPDKIIMVRGEEEITVPLYNPAAPMQRQPRQQRPQRKQPEKFYQQR